MEHPPPAPTPPGPAWRRAGPVALVLVVVVTYAVFLRLYMAPFAGGADSSGYLNSARLLGHGEFFTTARSLPGHTAAEFGETAFQPLGFLVQAADGRMAPTYPIGLPLHLLAGAGLAGWDRAAVVVNIFITLAAGGLLWAFARHLGLTRFSSAAGVIALWLCPLFLFCAMQPMSDLLALAWSLTTLYGALRARDRVGWGCLGGAALGLAVLVRPSNALLVIPVVLALGWRWRAYLAFGLGGLPAAALFFFYNWKVYGSPLLTGYGDVRSSFSVDFVGHNLVHFAHWIPMLLTPLVVFALAAPLVPKVRQRGFAVLAVWAATLIGFYVFYYHSGETWWYLRFILPAFPVLILATLAPLEAVAARIRSGPAIALGLALLFAAAGWLTWQTRQLHVLLVESDERTYPEGARWAREHIPARSVVFCMQVSGALFYYTDFLMVRWEQVAPDKYGALLGAIAAQDRPVYAALYDFETADAQARLGGRWTKLATVRKVTFWQRQP